MTSLNRCTARMGIALIALALMGGCATESHQALEVTKPAAAASAASYAGTRAALAVGNFDNRSTYMPGIFSDGVDRLGGQAKTILIGHLQETGRFNVMDRDNMAGPAGEAKLNGKQQTLRGAAFIIPGHVGEFCPKEKGGHHLFGTPGSGKER